MNVTVTRGGFEWASSFDLPITSLSGFRPVWSPSSPRAQRFRYPRLGAYMSCDLIPEDVRETFGHGCLHGPPPHTIRVIVKVDNHKRRTLDEVLTLAADAERLVEVCRSGVIADA